MQDERWKLTKGINAFCRPLLFVFVMALAMLMEKQHRAREERGYYELVKPRQRTAGPEKVVGLTVLVDFDSVTASVTKEMVDDFLNKRGGVSGQVSSVFDYFYNVSNGLMEYTNIVTSFNGYYKGAYSKIHLTEISDTGTAVMTFKIGEPVVFVSVRDITLQSVVSVGTHTLNGVVSPSDANNREIVWEVVDAGATNAVVTGNTLTTTSEGTIILRATIQDGVTIGPFGDHSLHAYTKEFTVVASNPPHYVITGSGTQFTATKHWAGHSQLFAFEQPIDTVMRRIRDDLNGWECSIRFGNGETLDIGAEAIRLYNSAPYIGKVAGYSKIALSGKITSANTSSTIILEDEIFATSEADVKNTSATGSAFEVRSTFTEVLTIRGGEITSAAATTSRGTIYNNSPETVEVLGGTISNTVSYGNAIYSANAEGSLVLGGTCNITGQISGFAAGKVSVGSTFRPGSNTYTFNPAEGGRVHGALAVVGGAAYSNNFELNSRRFTLAASGKDLTSLLDMLTGNTKFSTNWSKVTLLNRFLDIGTENIVFSENWGKITLLGRLTSASQFTTVFILNDLSESRADIRNTASGSAIRKSDEGTLTVSGGTIHANTGNAISNGGKGTLIVSGGTVRADSGYGIYNISSQSGIPLVTINGTAHITSANSDRTGGAIYNSGDLEIVGGRISNTVSGANAVYSNGKSFTLGGSPNITGLITSGGAIKIDSVVGFNPANRRYVLNPLTGERDSVVVVTNGAPYINNFSLFGSGHLLARVANDLVYCYVGWHAPISLGKAVAHVPVIDMESPDAEPTATSAGLTVGSNPTAKSVGFIKFFWEGKAIKGATLSIYDVSGSFVTKVRINDNGNNSSAKRVVGSWNLTDSKGRVVTDGSYVVKGLIITKDGERKNISIVTGVN